MDHYLGTAFFVTRNGIAFGAAHCLPKPSDVPDGLAVLAALMIDGVPKWHRVVASLVPNNTDVAILKVSAGTTPHLEVSFDRLLMGQDVESVGIPSHNENPRSEFDFRCLKGHVVSGTHPERLLDLSFEAPRGMSGSPVLMNGRAVGILLGSGRSEFLEDSTQHEEVRGDVTQVTKTEVRRVLHYGAAEHLWRLRDWQGEITGGLSLPAFIAKMNTGAA